MDIIQDRFWMTGLRMFDRSAPYYDKIYRSLDYETGAQTLRALIETRLPEARSANMGAALP